MGMSAAWIVVQGLDKAQALETLGMEMTDPVERDCLPEGWALTELAGGWLLVFEARAVIGPELESLAAFGPAVACDISESVMYSEARGYEGGKEQWRIVYHPDHQKGPFHALTISGTPPPSLMPIWDEERGYQNEYDREETSVNFICNVPTRVAASICGFDLTDDDPAELNFVNLRKVRTGKRRQAESRGGGFFTRLFGLD